MEELPDPDLDFEARAIAAARASRVATSFNLGRGDIEALDIDFYARDRALAWLVGIDRGGGWWESTVWLSRTGDGDWSSGDWKSGFQGWGQWEGWSGVAAERPDREWTFWGPILALSFGQSSGTYGSRHHVHCIAAAGVTAIEFGLKGHTRRRGVDTPTGAFVIAVAGPQTDFLPVLLATFRDGQVLDLMAT